MSPRPLSFVAITTFVAIGVVAAAPASLLAQKQAVVPSGMNASATLTPGIRNGSTLYVSGQTGTSRNAPDSTIEGQTKKALANVQRVVEAAGSDMSNVVNCTVFLTDVKNFAGMNSAYTSVFTKEPPARTTVVVAALVSPAAKVEIACIAAIPPK